MLSEEEVTTQREPSEPESDPAERRQHARKRLDVEVNFASDSNFYLGFAEDISEGGLFVATVMLQEIGSHITLSFALPDGEEITAAGVVRWLRDPKHDHADCVPGMGVQFGDLEPAQLAQIQQFVARREPIFYED